MNFNNHPKIIRRKTNSSNSGAIMTIENVSQISRQPERVRKYSARNCVLYSIPQLSSPTLVNHCASDEAINNPGVPKIIQPHFIPEKLNPSSRNAARQSSLAVNAANHSISNPARLPPGMK